jgi:hypothetical protein
MAISPRNSCNYTGLGHGEARVNNKPAIVHPFSATRHCSAHPANHSCTFAGFFRNLAECHLKACRIAGSAYRTRNYKFRGCESGILIGMQSYR